MMLDQRSVENDTTTSTNFFQEFYSHQSLTPITICVYVLGIVMGLPGSIGLMWYERNCSNRYRTVVNQMVSIGSSFLILYISLVFVPDGIRLLYAGPFSEGFCDLQIFVKNATWIGLMLTLDAVLVLRYIFIFHVKNFAVINDDVLALVIGLSIFWISVWGAVVKRFTPGNFQISYYLCSGLNPNVSIDDVENFSTLVNFTAKYNTGRIIIVSSFALHLMMLPRIFYYRLVAEKKKSQIQLGTISIVGVANYLPAIENPSTGRAKIAERFKRNKTIWDLATHIANFLALLFVGILVKIIDTYDPKCFNNEEFHWMPLMLQIYVPFLGGIGTLATFYTMNAGVQEAFARKYLSILQFLLR